MFNDRRRHLDDVMFTPKQISSMSANEVAEATILAADAYRRAKSISLVYDIVKTLDSVCKGSANAKQYAHHSQQLDGLVHTLLSLGSVHIVRRHLVPAVASSIRSASFIGDRRKSKVLSQWQTVVGHIDTVTV